MFSHLNPARPAPARTAPARSRRRTALTASALAALLLPAGCAGPPADGAGPRAGDSVAGFVSRTLPDGISATVLAARGDDLVYCAGFGTADRAAGTPASCRTVYDIMSVTKQFTAAAILKLEVMGRLRVDDRISRFLPRVPADKRAITVGQLLTHTSGLVESLGDDYEPVSRDEMIRRALASAPEAAPGAEWSYSNTGYSLLAAIVEKASGQGYEEFLAEHLFTPAGMRHTGYVLPDRPRHLVAVEYDDRGRDQGRPYDHDWAPDGPYWNLRGNGGMLSTAPDLLRWHRALRDDTVLPAEARAELFEPRVAEPGSDDFYAYGWNVRELPGGPFAWHDGGNGWSLALLGRTLRDDVLVFWVSNHAYRDGRWNLEDRAAALTQGVVDRVRAAGE